MKSAREALVAPLPLATVETLGVVLALSLAMRVATDAALRRVGFRLALATDLTVTAEASGGAALLGRVEMSDSHFDLLWRVSITPTRRGSCSISHRAAEAVNVLLSL
jgi:hypothetical protein